MLHLLRSSFLATSETANHSRSSPSYPMANGMPGAMPSEQDNPADNTPPERISPVAQLQSQEQTELFDVVDGLRKLRIDEDIDLPLLVLVGEIRKAPA